LVYVKFFNLIDLELSYPAEEIWVTSSTTLDELAVRFSKIYNVPEDALEGCRINNIFSFTMDDLIISSYDWL